MNNLNKEIINELINFNQSMIDKFIDIIFNDFNKTEETT